jgi:hypothetical protein
MIGAHKVSDRPTESFYLLLMLLERTQRPVESTVTWNPINRTMILLQEGILLCGGGGEDRVQITK